MTLWEANGCEPDFTHYSDFVSKEFMFMHGPSFGHAGVFNAKCSRGMTLALRRLTSVRKPGEMCGGVSLHEYLIQRQLEMRQKYPILDTFVETLSLRYTFGLTDVEMRERGWVISPNPKRGLRICADRALDDEGRRFDNVRVRNGVTTAKFKTGEINKSDGWPRMIDDLTVEGSSVAGYIMDNVKTLMSEEYLLGEFSSRFIKTPSSSEICEAFSSVLNGASVVHRYFSDDSIVGVKCLDGRLICNVDISSADLSYYEPVFELLEKLLKCDPSAHVAIDGVMKQLTLPVRITNPEDASERVTLFPQGGRYLKSGSTLTTLTNNIGNAAGMLIFYTRWTPLITMKEAEDLLVESYREAGMIITVERCENPEDLQFLKHSPQITDDVVECFLNLGVFFKGFGTFHGELPRTLVGARDWESRGRAFNSDVVKSYVHAGDHVITSAFRTKIMAYGDDSLETQGCGGFKIHTSTLCRRYNIEVTDLEELADMIVMSDIGDRIYHDVVDAVMLKDYSFKWGVDYPGDSTEYLHM